MKKYWKWLRTSIRKTLSRVYTEGATMNDGEGISSGQLCGYLPTYECTRKTAAQAQVALAIEEKTLHAKLVQEEKRLERERSPQRAMDKFLGGVDYSEVLALVKEHYPEKFI
jgi:hypothetical protein